MSAVSIKRIWQGALALTVLLSAILQYLDGPLKTAAAPFGIVSFEFSGSAEGAAVILKSWDAAARLHCALSLGLDALFPVAYGLAIALACLLVGRRLAGVGPRAGQVLCHAGFLAVGLDYLENIGLVRLLLWGPDDFWARLAWICAALKFLWVVVGMAFSAAGWAWLGLRAGGQPSA